MKRFLATSSILVFVGIVNAHEFWLRPQKYRFQVGEEMKVDLMVGENFEGELWDMTKHKVVKLELYNTAGKKEITNEVKTTKGKNLSFKFAAEGTHLFVLQSNAAFIELEGEKFNEYLKEDGLDNIIERRTKRGELSQPAKEHYTRYAKLIVQSGGKTDEIYKRKVGLKHEIIPLNNPTLLKSGDYMECRVLFNSQPARHQLVKVWNKIGNRIFLQNIFTEDDGSLKFPISNAGPWMVSTVRMEPSENGQVDYESSWASLVFGIE
jgi:uncharacterized GH25 family protein